MDVSQERSAGACSVQCEEKRMLGWGFLTILPMALVTALAALIFAGMGPALKTAGILVAVATLLEAITMRIKTYCRADWDDEQLVLSGSGKRPRPFTLRWLEIKRVKLFLKHTGGVVLELDRPLRHFRLMPTNRVVIPRDLAKKTELLEAIQTYVSPARIDPRVISGGEPSKRDILLNIGAHALGVAALIGTAFIIRYLREDAPVWLWMAPAFAMFWTVSPLYQRVGCDSRYWALVHGCSVALVWIIFPLLFFCLLTGRHDIITAFLLACAGLNAGLAVAVWRGKKAGTWERIEVPVVLVVIGWLAGQMMYGGIRPTRVAAGTLPFADSPWTPSGDGFLIAEGETSFIMPGPVTMRWYSSDLKPGHTVILPEFPRRVVVGETNAFCTVHEEGLDAFYLVPREGGEAKLVDSGVIDNGLVSSPEEESFLYHFTDMDPETWRISRFEDGALRDVRFPVPASEIKSLQWREDGSFNWMTLVAPATEGNEKVREAGAELCRLWTWRFEDAEPRLLYASDDLGRSWDFSPENERLTFHWYDPGTNLWEWKTVNPFEDMPHLMSAESPYERKRPRTEPEGRYAVQRGDSVLGLLMLEDRETGAVRPILCANGILRAGRFYRAPNSEKILFVDEQLRLPRPLFQWRRSSEDLIQTRSVVCLLDPEEF